MSLASKPGDDLFVREDLDFAARELVQLGAIPLLLIGASVDDAGRLSAVVIPFSEAASRERVVGVLRKVLDGLEGQGSTEIVEVRRAGDKGNLAAAVRTCRVCGCTDRDARQCIAKTGQPCYWVEPDLCSACVEEVKKS